MAINFPSSPTIGLTTTTGSKTWEWTGEGWKLQTITSVNVGNINSTGIVTATSFSGSGTNLTGIVTSIVAGTGVTISGSTGQVTINSTASGGGGGAALDILEVMLFA